MTSGSLSHTHTHIYLLFSLILVHQCYSHPEETMLTMMEVEVLELCTRTVTRTPTTSPATGLERIALSLKISPATLPEKKNTQRVAKQI